MIQHYKALTFCRHGLVDSALRLLRCRWSLQRNYPLCAATAAFLAPESLLSAELQRSPAVVVNCLRLLLQAAKNLQCLLASCRFECRLAEGPSATGSKLPVVRVVAFQKG